MEQQPLISTLDKELSLTVAPVAVCGCEVDGGEEVERSRGERPAYIDRSWQVDSGERLKICVDCRRSGPEQRLDGLVALNKL